MDTQTVQDFIIIRGAKVNNLKNIDVDIPRNKLIVITGLSGSGKTSLAFDTLYAEGQRRYVESLSSYARQFMGKLSKPEVDSIAGLPPAIAVEQKLSNRNVRSTVGTTTEIYEYLKLLYARVGRTFSPISNREVRCENTADVIKYLQSFPKGVKIYVLSPIPLVSGRKTWEQLRVFQQQGFNKIFFRNILLDIEDAIVETRKTDEEVAPFLLIDRIKSDHVGEQLNRLADSVQTAFWEGKGECIIRTEKDEIVDIRTFNNRFEADDMLFEEPSVHFFSFNNPYGACKTCSGTGIVESYAPELVIPDPSLSIFDSAVACWRGDKMSEWKNRFIQQAVPKGFPVHRAVQDLSQAEFSLLWNGNEKEQILGIKQFFQFVEENSYKIQFRVMQARYRGRIECPDCRGTRLRSDVNFVKIHGKSIIDLLLMPISELHTFFHNFEYTNDSEKQIAQLLVDELSKRCGFMVDVGLGYLNLNRTSKTLSGGESQRINLATFLGSSLVGSMYILDEPSIGLHSRDTHNLIRILKRLRDIGNTVIVVEHDEDIIRNADYIIDIGPKAGRLGGNVVFNGSLEQLLQQQDDLTAAYLRGMENPEDQDALSIEIPKRRRKWKNCVEIIEAREHNLKKINVKIPLEIFTVITGVSGSGKTTLIKNILYPALLKQFGVGGTLPIGKFSHLHIEPHSIEEVVWVDQNPIGRSSRSNPVTYIKAFDEIRALYASLPLAQQRGYTSGYFSINSTGGRCEECQGEGVIHVSMQFMSDIVLNCPECSGKRYKDEILEIKLREVNISDVLNMTIDQAVDFFETIPVSSYKTHILSKLSYLQEVGLGYLKMGQSSSTLSNGEAQRVKLAYYLSLENNKKKALFIFDEPTTGLHFHDINKLYHAFNKLIVLGHSILVIEHNMEIIKCADWIIDLGPEGGEQGGEVLAEGTPELLVTVEKSYTGQALKKKLG
jgi:excinuclease ABC subunit A